MPLNRGRFVNPGLAVATLVLLACGGRVSTRNVVVEKGPRVTPSHADTIAVYRRALETLYESTSERPGVIVLLDSATRGVARFCPDSPCQLSPAVDSHVEASALRNYSDALSQRGPIPRDLNRAIRVERVSETELATFRALGERRPNDADRHGQPPDPSWDHFRTRFPGAWGLTSVTRIGFSDDADQALLQITHTCGNNCARTESMFFEKRYGTWFIESRFPEDSRDWIGQGELRYVGPDAKARVAYLRVVDAAAMSVADSIRQEKSPRRLRGSVFNRSPDIPIPYAEIFFGSTQLPSGTFLRATADQSGRFEIIDPPIGGFIVAAQCPRSPRAEEKVLAGAGFYLRPGADTSITLVAPNLRPCLKADRIFPLTSGWLESTAAASATAPTQDEAGVYVAALRYLIKHHGPARIAAVANRTVESCSFSKRCGSLQLPRLVSEGVVDTSTLGEFRRRPKKRELLNPAFARPLHLRVLTDDEIRFLAREAEPRARPMDKLEDETGLFWIGFRKLYGRHARIVALTRASFNRAHTEALLEVRIDSGAQEWDGRPTMLLLRKSSGDWRVVNGNLGRGETSGKWVGGRCMPVSPAERASKSDIGALAGQFDITIIGLSDYEFAQTKRVRIARNTIPLWEGFGSPRPAQLERIPHSFEELDGAGQVDSAATSVLSIIGIPQNIAKNPRIVTLDGEYERLTIKDITDLGFSGTYVAGAFGDSQWGYFCARPITPH